MNEGTEGVDNFPMDLEEMDILEDLEGTADGEVLGGLFPQLVGNEDILGLETVPEKFLGQGIDEEGRVMTMVRAMTRRGVFRKRLSAKNKGFLSYVELNITQIMCSKQLCGVVPLSCFQKRNS